MAWFIGQSAVMIVLAFLLGLLVGWLIWHTRGSTADAAVADVATDVLSVPSAMEATTIGGTRFERRPEPAAAVAVTPTLDVDEPKPAPIDDLARIEGIGPKIAGALVEAGIRSYEQLAAARLSDLQAATRAAQITFTPSINTWARQAALLAARDEDGFKALTDRLIAGREPGAPLAAEDEAAVIDTPVAPDPLDRIEGIGPKIAAALIAGGIRTYREVAAADVPALESAINQAGIKFAPSISTWSQQAALLAAGDEAGFADLIARLVAGREPARQA